MRGDIISVAPTCPLLPGAHPPRYGHGPSAWLDAGFSRPRALIQLAQLLSSPRILPAELSSRRATRLVVDEDSSHAILCTTPPGFRPPPAPGPLRAAPRPPLGRTAQRRRSRAGPGATPGLV